MTIYRLACAAAVYAATLTPAVAGTLLADGRLQTTNDLTRIQVGSQVLEFLDLNVTQGMSVAAAVQQYGPSGFHWAKGAEVSELLGAFGMSYVGVPTIAAPITGAGLAERTSFVSRVGDTYNGFRLSLGWLDDMTTNAYHSYTCIAVNQCNAWSYVNNTNRYWPSDANIGVFLVRAVPEASTLAMSLAGVAVVLGWVARRRSARTNQSTPCA